MTIAMGVGLVLLGALCGVVTILLVTGSRSFELEAELRRMAQEKAIVEAERDRYRKERDAALKAPTFRRQTTKS